MIIDKYGLPIESQGAMDKNQSGFLSSIMKNSARLHAMLLSSEASGADAADTQKKVPNEAGDSLVKIEFKNENLLLRNKQGVTLAIRQH